MKTGVLLHVYHLDTLGWEELVWGVPEEDRLGSGPVLAWLMLTEPKDAPIASIVIGCGPSEREGLTESEYTKKYLLDHFDELEKFPRLATLMKDIGIGGRKKLRQRLEATMLMPLIRGTIEEVAKAAEMLQDVDRVIQIAGASHAPRCAQIQATARLEGRIPAWQQWLVMPSDICFNGSRPDETVVIEPPHRGDYALTHEKPTLAELLKPTLYMHDDDKRALIALMKDFVERRQTNG